MKIRALASIAGKDYTYAKGGVYSTPESIGRQLVESGLAELVGVAKKAETAVKREKKIQRRKK